KINDKAHISVNEIRAQCRMVKNLGLIVVDYLQLMKSSKKHDNRNQEVGAISRELKILASELGVPVLCLSQLNRTNDEEKRPSPCDLRDSGEIEQNCSKLILMWCVEKNFNEAGAIQSKTIGVDVALNRRGSSGTILMNFNGNHMSFIELDRKYEKPTITSGWKPPIHR
ncbi:MAG: replicative DNA helicase, partial [Oscillospiraceae bacterium]|nr:replicative DNA helicase [Oscillospiraceae bacterium]